MDPRLKSLVDKSQKIVFFGGAGVSTESNIPDFRSESGIYHARNAYGYSPESIVSADFYFNKNEVFYKFYKENLVYADAEPNDAHKALAKLEKEGKISAVVTQNIDGLHQKAGNSNVFELHGSVARNYCEKCGKFYDLEYIMNENNCRKGVPYCSCSGRIKPDVVLFGEMLNDEVIAGAIKAISEADLLIVGGTSLAVYPAAGLINYYRGKDLVLINKTETPFDDRASLVIYDSIGKVLKY
ncbi:MAG: NAD-dependent protein deacylase [Eubacterium sp.]|nr:NAD-dependent protein deacylase [Eubacterium sp.]